MKVTGDELVQAGLQYVTLVQALDDEGLDKAVGLEQWALAWGARLMDTAQELLREAGANPEPGSRTLLRLWVDPGGLLQCSIDLPKEGGGQDSGGIADEAHFAALYEQLTVAQRVLGTLVQRLRGTTGVQ